VTTEQPTPQGLHRREGKKTPRNGDVREPLKEVTGKRASAIVQTQNWDHAGWKLNIVTARRKSPGIKKGCDHGKRKN